MANNKLRASGPSAGQQLKFCQTSKYFIPLHPEDRTALVNAGLTSTKFPIPTLPWVKAAFFKSAKLEIIPLNQVVYDLCGHLIKALPEGITAQPLPPLGKEFIADLRIWEPESDSTDEAASKVLGTLFDVFKHYLGRYCLAMTAQSQSKSGGTLWRLLIEQSDELPNSHYFQPAFGPSTVATLSLSSSARFSLAIEPVNGQQTFAVRWQDRSGQTEWTTALQRNFLMSSVSRDDAKAMIDFLLANFA